METHLYLTDYRSLYVAHVGEITADDPADHEDEEERNAVPHYYRAAAHLRLLVPPVGHPPPGD